MRTSTPVYCYHHKQFIKKVYGRSEAAELANTSVPTITKVISGKMDCTKDGWVFTEDELSDEELKSCPDSNRIKPNLEKINGKRKKVVDGQEYEVDVKNGYVTHIPRTHSERVGLLKTLIFRIAKDRWMRVPRQVAALEKTALGELLENI